MNNKLVTKDTISVLFAVVLGIVYLVSTAKIPVMDAGDQIGPRAFPYLIAAMVIICGLTLLVKEFFNTERKPFSFNFVADRGIWFRIFLIMAAGITYGLVLDWLGYLIATIIFMVFVGGLINVGRHVQNLIIAVLFSVTTFVAFALILKLSMPRGLLGFLPF
jgi:putative tricarboxylic transport membrane protein